MTSEELGSFEIREYYKELLDSLGNFSDEERSRINAAYEYAKAAHEEVAQFRKSGEPYIIHPLAVAKILASFGMDVPSIQAALLHDVAEDTPRTIEDVRQTFGQEVATLVDGVTKMGHVPLKGKEEQQAENLRKLLLAMTGDIRVIIIKLADRLHNMRTLSFVKQAKRRDTARETLEIYAPIAHRLGIRAVKEELEDLAIGYLDPVSYEEISCKLSELEPKQKDFLNYIVGDISARVTPLVSDCKITSRIKSVHGIYRKMYMQGKLFEEIYDIYAVRIIVDTVPECYNCLGVIHDMYTPLVGRFKDYISTPKTNGYQSLHTTVLSREGVPFEVQIRTFQMHRTAEYGVAAHWKYKLGFNSNDPGIEKGMGWVRQLLATEDETGEVGDILSGIKTDINSEEVYVFTPKGKVISLPAGSTVIDFAYAIHSEVGNHMTGAKVNKRIVPIDYRINNGEIIEIMTSPSKTPSRDWLTIVKTNEARAKIRSWFKKERRDENIVEGRNMLDQEMRRGNIRLTDEQLTSLFAAVTEHFRLSDPDDLFAALGYGGLAMSKVMPNVRDEAARIIKAAEAKQNELEPVLPPVKMHTVSAEGVVVEGIDNCLIKLSRCCNPIPGDEIIGFITRGRGVSVHKRSCTNVPRDISKASEPERWIDVYWASGLKANFSAPVQLICLNRNLLMMDIVNALANMRVVLQSVNTRNTSDGRVQLKLVLVVNSMEHLNNIVARLKRINGVLSVDRTNAAE